MQARGPWQGAVFGLSSHERMLTDRRSIAAFAASELHEIDCEGFITEVDLRRVRLGFSRREAGQRAGEGQKTALRARIPTTCAPTVPLTIGSGPNHKGSREKRLLLSVGSFQRKRVPL